MIGNRLQLAERRRFIRHPLFLPLAYKIIKPSTRRYGEGSSRTQNISMGGLLFPTKHPIKANTTIAIKMPFQNRVFDVKGKVLRCLNNHETNLYDVAVSFLRLKEAFKARMIEQVYLIAEYRNLLSFEKGKEVSFEEASRKWIKRYSERFKKLYW